MRRPVSGLHISGAIRSLRQVSRETVLLDSRRRSSGLRCGGRGRALLFGCEGGFPNPPQCPRSHVAGKCSADRGMGSRVGGANGVHGRGDRVGRRPQPSRLRASKGARCCTGSAQPFGGRSHRSTCAFFPILCRSFGLGETCGLRPSGKCGPRNAVADATSPLFWGLLLKFVTCASGAKQEGHRAFPGVRQSPVACSLLTGALTGEAFPREASSTGVSALRGEPRGQAPSCGPPALQQAHTTET